MRVSIKKFITGNIANANTPGYRARALRFEDAFQEALASGDGAKARAVEAEVFEPRSTAVDNDGNDVSVDREAMLLSKCNVVPDLHQFDAWEKSVIARMSRSGG